MATGLLLAIVGVFLVLRTVVKNGRGNTLVDEVLAL